MTYSPHDQRVRFELGRNHPLTTALRHRGREAGWSTGANDSVCTGASGGAMARFEVITGPERRRRWSEDQKRAIVAESFAPGAVVSDVARRADISAGQIYRWR